MVAVLLSCVCRFGVPLSVHALFPICRRVDVGRGWASFLCEDAGVLRLAFPSCGVVAQADVASWDVVCNDRQ